MIPTAEQATVYRGGGRRWLTKRAACRAEARAKLRKRCECERGDHITPPVTCWHHDERNYQRLVRRLTRIYEKAMQSAKEGKS
jgi:hypothetical protein